MSGMDDVFGVMARPDHPDFWKLSETILRHDGAMEAVEGEDEKNRVYASLVAEHIDIRSLAYVAVQRAIRAADVGTRAEMIEHAAEVNKLAGIYMDAFVIACAFMADREEQ